MQQVWHGPIASGAVAAGGVTLYRVWGGASAQQGAWLTPTVPAASSVARSMLALPSGNNAEFVSAVRVPEGTWIQIGIVAPAFGQPGGGAQIQLLERIPLNRFGPGVRLPP
ncbi:MAG TPA: hypothetical protein VGG99_14290 [Acetobacteraceae bacterium]